MKNLIIGWLFFMSPSVALAYNQVSAKYYLEAGVKASILNINLSQDAINKILLKKYGARKINQMDQKQFKDLIVDYIKSNFYFSIDKKKMELKEGGIKLSNYQIDLNFVLPPLPKEMEELFIHIPAFKENDHHQTIFSYNLFGKIDKVILGITNNYKSTINLNNQPHSYNRLWTPFCSLLSVVAVIFLILKKEKKKN